MLPVMKMFKLTFMILCLHSYFLPLCKGDVDSLSDLMEHYTEEAIMPEDFMLLKPLKLELIDGVMMSYAPEAENREGVVNFTMNVPEFRKMINGDLSEARKKQSSGNIDKKLLRRILPLFVIPFLIQSALIPMFLSSLKMMLMKSMMVGKLALLLIGINALRTSNIFKSRSEERIADKHYGFHGSGMEELGSFVNKRNFNY